VERPSLATTGERSTACSSPRSAGCVRPPRYGGGMSRHDWSDVRERVARLAAEPEAGKVFGSAEAQVFDGRQ